MDEDPWPGPFPRSPSPGPSAEQTGRFASSGGRARRLTRPIRPLFRPPGRRRRDGPGQPGVCAGCARQGSESRASHEAPGVTGPGSGRGSVGAFGAPMTAPKAPTGTCPGGRPADWARRAPPKATDARPTRPGRHIDLSARGGLYLPMAPLTRLSPGRWRQRTGDDRTDGASAPATRPGRAWRPRTPPPLPPTSRTGPSGVAPDAAARRTSRRGCPRRVAAPRAREGEPGCAGGLNRDRKIAS
jgi:hypothetical protein